MMHGAACDLLLFVGASFVFGTACAPRGSGDCLLRFAAGIAIALGAVFLIGFVGFAAGWSNTFAGIVAAGLMAGAIAFRRSSVAVLMRDREVREFLTAWIVFAAWSIGLLALVRTYSGGGWAVDWLEHWQRTLFFARRESLGTHFVGMYSLTARPPLANLLVALAMAGRTPDFSDFQVLMTLFGTLILLPVWVLACRWRAAPSAGWWAVIVLMGSPLVAQNLTFAWTKLPTAFFVLTAVCLCTARLAETNCNRAAESAVPYDIETLRPPAGSAPAPGMPASPSDRWMSAAAVCLGLGMLTHYSAGPWILALGIGYVGTQHRRWRKPRFWAHVAVLAGILIATLAVWLGWAVIHFGWRGTFASNTTAGAWDVQTPWQRITVPFGNLFDTIVPFPLRGEPGDGLITEASRLGRLRDVAFNLYQVNLPIAFGFAGLSVLLLRALGRNRTPKSGLLGPAQPEHANRSIRVFYSVLVPLIILLGIAVHTPRDRWGLAHICLQPLVLLGLGWIASVLAGAPARIRAVWALFAVVDVVLGMVLQFGIESWAFAHRIAPLGGPIAFLRELNRTAAGNALDKWSLHLEFFADRLHGPAPWVVLWLGLCAAAVLLRLIQTQPTSAAGIGSVRQRW